MTSWRLSVAVATLLFAVECRWCPVPTGTAAEAMSLVSFESVDIGVVNREGVHVLQNSDDCRAAALMPASDVSRKLDSTVGKKQYVRVSDAGLKRW